MALIPIVIGLGFVVGGSIMATNAAHRRPLPVDVRAPIITAFQSGNDQTIAKVLDAVRAGANGVYKHQAAILAAAIQTGLDALKTGTTTPADVSALWWAAIKSGDPVTMRKAGQSLTGKYSHLSSALIDCARILGG